MVVIFFAFIGAAVTHFLLGDSASAGRTIFAVLAGIIAGITAGVVATYLIAGIWDIGVVPLVSAILGPIGVWVISRRSRPRELSKGDLRNK